MARASFPAHNDPMPKLVRFVLVNSLIGMAFGWLVAAGILYFNIANLGTLVSHASNKWVAYLILGMSFGATFAFAYLATAVWLLPTDKDDFDRM